MIAVIGDIILDRYIYGSSTRFSPECETAPVMSVFKEEYALGGAANTALNIKNLKQAVTLFGTLELTNYRVKQLINSNGLNHVLRNNLNKDVEKTRIICNGNYIARVDEDNIAKYDDSNLIRELFEISPNIIVISDYNKGTIVNAQDIITIARTKNIPVLVDPKVGLDSYKGCTVLKPNLKEFLDYADITEELFYKLIINDPNYFCDRRKELEVDYLIITLGSKGCLLVEEYRITKYPSLPIKAIDVTGAGDSFMAGLAVAIAEKKSLPQAINFANMVASIAVTKKGTGSVTRNEIKNN